MRYIFNPVYDFDGNVLSPQTVNFFQNTMTNEIVEVLVHEVDQNPRLYFESGQFKFPDNDPEETFQRFRDYFPNDSHPGPDGLIHDTLQAIKTADFPPSFHNFKQLALIEAQMFAILTARGHAPDNIQRAIQIISQETLTPEEKKNQIENIKEKYSHLLKKYRVSDHKIVDRFFSHIPSYMGVNNINFCKQSHIDWYKSSGTKKAEIIDIHFQRSYNIFGKEASFAKGFSDDGERNIIPMAKKFLKDKEIRPQDKYRLYFTGKVDKRDKVIESIKQLPGSEDVEFVDEKDILKIRIHN